MARFSYHGTTKDGSGAVIESATIAVFLADGTTAANIYPAESGGSAVNSITSDSTNGTFVFFVDTGDYANTQEFKVQISKTNYITQTYDDVKIFPGAASEVSIDSASGKFVDDLFDGGYDVPVKPSKIFGGVTNTNGHDIPDVADDTLSLLAATQTLSAKTLVTPTIASFTNATHNHSNAAGGGLITKEGYINLQHQESSGTAGGTLTATTWTKRTVNTEVADTNSDASVASSVITLAAGTYRCSITAETVQVGLHQLRLRNTTDGSTALAGLIGRAIITAAATTYPASLRGRFTIAASKAFEIQHYVNATKATDGMGAALSSGEGEVYLVAEFWKEV